MPTVTYGPLFGSQRFPESVQLKPKQGRSTDIIDVKDASVVHMMIGVSGGKGQRKKMRWSVSFGPYTAGSWARTHEGDFEQTAILALTIPVYGPQLTVSVRNGSDKTTRVDGNIRIIRNLTP